MGVRAGTPPLPSAPGRDKPNAHPPLAGPVLQLNIDDLSPIDFHLQELNFCGIKIGRKRDE
jgi:hypothetical protein